MVATAPATFPAIPEGWDPHGASRAVVTSVGDGFIIETEVVREEQEVQGVPPPVLEHGAACAVCSAAFPSPWAAAEHLGSHGVTVRRGAATLHRLLEAGYLIPNIEHQ